MAKSGSGNIQTVQQNSDEQTQDHAYDYYHKYVAITDGPDRNGRPVLESKGKKEGERENEQNGFHWKLLFRSYVLLFIHCDIPLFEKRACEMLF